MFYLVNDLSYLTLFWISFVFLAVIVIHLSTMQYSMISTVNSSVYCWYLLGLFLAWGISKSVSTNILMRVFMNLFMHLCVVIYMGRECWVLGNVRVQFRYTITTLPRVTVPIYMFSVRVPLIGCTSFFEEPLWWALRGISLWFWSVLLRWLVKLSTITWLSAIWIASLRECLFRFLCFSAVSYIS